jgi:long-subunit fatty acid transport protein
MQEQGQSFKVKRTDSDLALNYRLNDYFKVFFGAKYLGYSIPRSDVKGFGPGLGLSITYPIINDIFLLATLSGFHLWFNEDNKNDVSKNSRDYGFNSTLALAYYIAPASTAISLGGRYQVDKQYYVDISDSDKKTTKFYGITLTAIYTFSI